MRSSDDSRAWGPLIAQALEQEKASAADGKYVQCGHFCLHASDVGVGVAGDPVAYPHPGCPVHGYCDKYVPGSVQSNGHRPCANCLGYEDEHSRGGEPCQE